LEETKLQLHNAHSATQEEWKGWDHMSRPFEVGSKSLPYGGFYHNFGEDTNRSQLERRGAKLSVDILLGVLNVQRDLASMANGGEASK